MSDVPDEAPRPADEIAVASAPPGAREILLRAALGAILGLVPGAALLLLEESTPRERHLFLGLGLFLGGLAGLAGYVERLGARRSVPAQVGLALVLCLLASAWGIAAIFQAERTFVALTTGADAADARVDELLVRLLERKAEVLQMFLPLGGVVAAQTLVRTRRGGWRAHLGALVLPILLGAVWSDDSRKLTLVFGPGLFATSAVSAWAAGALVRRWWPASGAEPSRSEAPP